MEHLAFWRRGHVSTAVVQELDYVRGGGGRRAIKPEEKLPLGFRAVGILYVRQVTAADQVEMELRYESHVTDAVKVAIAERFGEGAKAWKVSEET